MRVTPVLAGALSCAILGCHPGARTVPPQPSPLQQSLDCDAIWWLTVRFHPVEQAVEGIPLHTIDSTWVAAQALTPASMPPAWRCQSRQTDDPTLAFALSADFNRDGLRDRALVGVYRTSAAVEGQFLLIVTQRTRGRWEVAELFTIPGQAGFSVLSYYNNTIAWWMCLECDDGLRVAWDGQHYRLLPDETREP